MGSLPRAAGALAEAPPDALPPPGSGPAADPAVDPRLDPGLAPEISVVIPHLNQPARLAACLAALAAQDFGGAFEVIVVDNGSGEAPEAAVAALAGTLLAAEAAPGPGPARNRGAALSRAPILAFTDADCLPEPGWLAAIAARFAADPGLSVIGGEVRVFAADPARPSLSETVDMVWGFRQRRQIDRHGFAATANLAVRRQVFEAVGPFAGIALAEDMDWGQRAARLGHRTRFVPEAVVRHPARPSMAALRAQWDRHIAHHWRMAPEGARGRLAWTLAAAGIALSPLAEIATVARTDRLEGPGARLRALAGIARLRLYRARRMIAVMVLGAEPRDPAQVWNRG